MVGGIAFADGIALYPRTNVVLGIPLVLYGSQYPGGKALNYTPKQGGPGCVGPFCRPPIGEQGDFGRNVLRGFGAAQADIAFQRQFHFTEKVQLRFQGDFFNIFNHPNFGPPDNNITDSLFAFLDGTAGKQPRLRRREWRPQSPLPDWWTTLDPVGTQDAILNRLSHCKGQGFPQKSY